jgi:hypothetical protein
MVGQTRIVVRYIAALVIGCLLFCATPVLAGGVLVPSGNSDSKSGGFSSIFGFFSPKPSGDTMSNSASQTQTQTAPAPTPETKEVVAPAPVVQPVAPSIVPAKPKTDIVGKNPVPPRIFDEVNTSEFINHGQGSNGIAISFLPQYTFSPSDYSEIQKKLGYSPDEVKAYCKLGSTLTFNLLGGNKETDIREYRLASGVQIQGNYDGVLQKVMVRLAVLCKPPAALPQSGQIIFRSGDLYSVHLMSISRCAPERPRPSALILQYNGNGQSGCLFKY